LIDTMIKRLRNKIDNGFDKKLIHTVRGMGYILEPRLC
ncbi:MAG: winged helix-turn-helix domain-containing protein, partial [Campylobacteraceae bacterium]|nr:winged helix-turn-helix domain-containing protein [Campylobacteraceae bacterium]